MQSDEILESIDKGREGRGGKMNAGYPLAAEHDPDFDKPHRYTKSHGDGSIRDHCRCERPKDDPIHIAESEACPNCKTVLRAPLLCDLLRKGCPVCGWGTDALPDS